MIFAGRGESGESSAAGVAVGYQESLTGTTHVPERLC
jgi:hypothetical protein